MGQQMRERVDECLELASPDVDESTPRLSLFDVSQQQTGSLGLRRARPPRQSLPACAATPSILRRGHMASSSRRRCAGLHGYSLPREP